MFRNYFIYILFCFILNPENIKEKLLLAMFGGSRNPDSSHQIDGGKKLRAFTNFMVLKKTPEKIMRSPEDPYFIKDMEENARDL